MSAFTLHPVIIRVMGITNRDDEWYIQDDIYLGCKHISSGALCRQIHALGIDYFTPGGIDVSGSQRFMDIYQRAKAKYPDGIPGPLDSREWRLCDDKGNLISTH
jgi:hypothetical protein